MGRPQKSEARKQTYYIRPVDRVRYWFDWATENPSEKLAAAMVTMIALPPGVGDEITRQTQNLPVEQAIKVARKLIENAVLDQWRVKVMRNMPEREQVKRMEKVRK